MSNLYSSLTPEKGTYIRQEKELYIRAKDLLSGRIHKLDNFPETQGKTEAHLERLLNDIHFFAKPDIIPYPDDYSSDYLRKQTNEMLDRNSSIKAETKSMQNQRSRNLPLRGDYDTLLERYNNLEIELKQSHAKNGFLSSQIVALKQQLERSAGITEENLYLKNKSLQEELEKNKKEIETLQDKSSENKLNSRIKSLEQELSEYKNSKLIESDNVLEEKLRHSYEQINKLEKELKEVHTLCERKEELNNKLKNDLRKLTGKINSLDNTLDDKAENPNSKQREGKTNSSKAGSDKQKDPNLSVSKETIQTNNHHKKRENLRSAKQLPLYKRLNLNRDLGYCITCANVHKHPWAKPPENKILNLI